MENQNINKPYKDLAYGYLIQLISIGALLSQHFFLPLILGFEEYGKLTITLAIGSILFSAFDHGYNLLGTKNKTLQETYHFYKLIILSLASSSWLIYDGITKHNIEIETVCGITYALGFIIYTSKVYSDISKGRMRQATTASIFFGLASLITPILLHFTDNNISLSPAISIWITIFTLNLRPEKNLANNKFKKKILNQINFLHFRKSLKKQFEISINTILDSLIIWGGLLFVSSTEGPEHAAIYRITMSCIALMAQTLPSSRPVVVKLVYGAESNRNWANKLIVVLLFTASIQISLFVFIGDWTLTWMFNEKGKIIYNNISNIIFLPAIKTIFEIQTVFSQKANKQQFLIYFLVFSTFITWQFSESIYQLILNLYVQATLFCCFLIYSKYEPRKRHNDK